MKTGFKQSVEEILRKNGMRNGVGKVSKNSEIIRKHLTNLGYSLTDDDFNVDFMYISRKQFREFELQKALTKLKNCGIIVINVGNKTPLEIRKGC